MRIKDLPLDIRRMAFEEAKLQRNKVTLESDINKIDTFHWQNTKYGNRFWLLCEKGCFKEARFVIDLEYSPTKELILLIKHLLK